jgi:hypothetical protein
MQVSAQGERQIFDEVRRPSRDGTCPRSVLCVARSVYSFQLFLDSENKYHLKAKNSMEFFPTPLIS